MPISKSFLVILLLYANTATFFLYADSILFLPDPNKKNDNMQYPSTYPQSSSKHNNTLDNDYPIKDSKKKQNPNNLQYSIPKDTEDSKKSQPDTSPPQYNNILQPNNKQIPHDLTNADLLHKHSATLALNVSQSSKNPKTASAQYNIANGTTFIAVTSVKKPQSLQIGKKHFTWIPHPTDSSKHIAFVPIGYYTKPQIIDIGNAITLNIIQGNYRKEQITITDTNKVKPNTAANQRITQELAEANKIYTTYTKKRYWNQTFIYPLSSDITSPFGSARVFNGEVKSYHSGTDFRAAMGTPIVASNNGIVVLAKDRFLAGKSVVISHGEGVFSMYYHCSEIKVHVGQNVQRGEVIALSGDTGRVNAPHLHFAMMIHGTQVDPIQFIDSINALF